MNTFLKIRYFLFRTILSRVMRISFQKTYLLIARRIVTERTFESGLMGKSICLDRGLEEILENMTSQTGAYFSLGFRKKFSDDDGKNPSRPYYTGAICSKEAFSPGRVDVVIQGDIKKNMVAVVGLCNENTIWGIIELTSKDLGSGSKLVSIVRSIDYVAYKINNLTVCAHDIDDPAPYRKLNFFVALAVRDGRGGVDDITPSSLKVFRYCFTEYINKHAFYNLNFRNVWKMLEL